MGMNWKRFESEDTEMLISSENKIMAIVSRPPIDPNYDPRPEEYVTHVFGKEKGYSRDIEAGKALAEAMLERILSSQIEEVQRLTSMRKSMSVSNPKMGELVDFDLERISVDFLDPYIVDAMKARALNESVPYRLFENLEKKFKVDKVNRLLVASVLKNCDPRNMGSREISSTVITALRIYESAMDIKSSYTARRSYVYAQCKILPSPQHMIVNDAVVEHMRSPLRYHTVTGSPMRDYLEIESPSR